MKRRLLIIGICLLLGAVVNVAVAWGCAYCPKPTARRRYAMPTPDQVAWWEARAPDGVESEPLIVATMPPSFGCLYQSLGGPRPDPDSGIWEVRIFGGGDGFTTEITFAKGISSPDARRFRGRPPWDYAHQVQAGWPLTSVEGERWEIGVAYRSFIRALIAPTPTTSGGAVYAASVGIQRSSSTGPALRLLPFRPLPLGFAINTIFYATLLWLLIFGMSALRRYWRVEQGFCPKCAYPMGESSVCTECGCGLRARTT